MKTTPTIASNPRQFIVAFGLAVLLAIAGAQTTLKAQDGGGAGSGPRCSLFALIWSWAHGIDCHLYEAR